MGRQADETPPTAAVTVHWLGVAGVAIAAGERCVLIDPYFSRLPLRRLALGRPLPDEARIAAAWQQLPARVAAIAVGHTHVDHALDLPVLARLTAAPVFGSASLDALLARSGLPRRATVCRPGETRALPGLGHLTVMEGAHGGVLLGRPPFPGTIEAAGPYPLPARAYRAGTVLILDLTLAGQRFVHVGSAGMPASALPEGRCDVLFLCVPGWRAQPDYPAAYLRRLQPRRIVPVHFDRLTRPLDDPRVLQPGPVMARVIDLPGFLARLRDVAPDIPVVLPRLWGALDFGEHSA